VKTDNIQGLAELRAKLEALTHGLYGEEAARVFLTAARKIRDVARREAPVSTWPVVSRWNGKDDKQVRRAQGALRRAIVSYQLRKNAAVWGGPAAVAQVNILRGRDVAPHGHLVEFGTRARKAKNGKLMPFPAKGGRGWIFAREVQGTPANPFFRRAIDSAGPAALDAAALAVKRMVEQAGVKQ
jgi:HK97 gp10 family phage protein